MTLPQIHGFLRAIAKRNANEQSNFITGVAIGSQGDGKAIKKALDTYNKIKKDVIREQREKT